MKTLIYKEDLLAEYDRAHVGPPGGARKLIAEATAVDAVEVVHGRWMFVTKGQHTSVYVCSKCNRAIVVVCDEDEIKEQLAKKYPYCHCGAKMDGVKACLD